MIAFTIVGFHSSQTARRIGRGRMYTNDAGKNYRHMVQTLARVKCKEPYDCPVKVELQVRYAAPKRPKWLREACLSGHILPTTKPDAQNMGKEIYDSLEGIVYHNDSYICQETMSAYYHDGENEVIVIIEPLPHLGRQGATKVGYQKWIEQGGIERIGELS